MSSWNIYVDGSYHALTDRSSYAYAVIRYDICFFKEYGIVPDAQGTRNIAGELTAVKKALGHVLKTCTDPINIFYDFTGIEAWATGLWDCNHAISKDYREFIQGVMKIHNIAFTKVKSHSNNPWNDYVDELAKKAFIYEEIAR